MQGINKSCPTSCSDTRPKQGTLHSSVDTGSTKVEIKWALKSVVSCCSVRKNDYIKTTFDVKFPDSNIAKRMTLNRTKSMYAFNYGLAPFFEFALMSNLQKSAIHTYSFNQNLHEVTQTCEMDLYLHYWGVFENLVPSRYYGSSFLGTCNLHVVRRSLITDKFALE